MNARVCENKKILLHISPLSVQQQAAVGRACSATGRFGYVELESLPHLASPAVVDMCGSVLGSRPVGHTYACAHVCPCIGAFKTEITIVRWALVPIAVVAVHLRIR